MRQDRSLRFDALEGRQLLTKVHPAAAPPIHKVVEVAPTLNGTLTVNQKGASAAYDAFGNFVRTIPVSGVLGGVGKVKGVLTEGISAYGTPSTTDTIQLHDPQGSFTLSFDTTHFGTARPTATGASFARVTQQITGGTGEFAKAHETGLLVANTTATKSAVVSLTLTTDPA